MNTGFIATNPPTWVRDGIIERLVALWTVERRSATECGRILSREFRVRVTRNAVLGKLYRLGLMRSRAIAACTRKLTSRNAQRSAA